MPRIKPGAVIRERTLKTIKSEQVQIPDSMHMIHLQFRRFAGCPFCSMHLGTIVRRYDEILAAGIREVVVFRSTDAALRSHHADIPFAIVADPKDELYNEFGVGSRLRSVLDPRALWAAANGVVRMLPKLPGIPPWGKGALGLPADFLISTDGRVLASNYGVHAYDQWPVDQLLDLARPRLV